MEVPKCMIVLWISGLTWDLLNRVPGVALLRAQGAAVINLEPLPITGPKPQAWQMISGRNPGGTGYFDSWMPQQHTMQPVAEPTVPMLHEVIAAAGRTATYVNLALADVPLYLNELEARVDCLVVRTVAGNDMVMIDQAITAAQARVGTDETCLLLSDHHETAVKRYVNLNNGLRSLDVLEVSRREIIRWEETLAYHIGHGQIWINLQGREPLGIVAYHEYDQTCQALVTSLPRKLLDPESGVPVIERVYRRNELYHGDYLFRAPDLVAVLRPGYAPSPNSVLLGFDDDVVGPAPVDTRTTAGLHPATVAGLAIAVGLPFAAGQVIAQAPLTSIAPTILHALGLPIPMDIDAEVITDLFVPTFMQQFPIQRAEQRSGLSREDEEEIITRLRGLGYLE